MASHPLSGSIGLSFGLRNASASTYVVAPGQAAEDDGGNPLGGTWAYDPDLMRHTREYLPGPSRYPITVVTARDRAGA